MKQSARIKNMDQTLKNTLGICALLAFCFGAAIASGYHLEYEYGYRYSAVGALASVVFYYYWHAASRAFLQLFY
ncbi:division cluster competence-associated protein [Neisseria gonorrhoeae]|uniref:hypothetical protein n=1 Tax=Neisseria gonorrhoeae TaxID=485 RepID=UPI0005E455F3|nr:division cluster competence-associated protein [Neisseria gonorrhoeae]